MTLYRIVTADHLQYYAFDRSGGVLLPANDRHHCFAKKENQYQKWLPFRGRILTVILMR